MTESTFKKVYRVPIVLAAITLVGLISALLGDGIWDAFSWVLLAIPIVLLSYILVRPRSSAAKA